MPTTLLQSDLPGMPLRHRGKVRDVFDIPRERLPAGTPPGDYLLRWRVSIAQAQLRSGTAVKSVSDALGYASPAAFSRAFTQVVGASPRAWLKAEAPETVGGP